MGALGTVYTDQYTASYITKPSSQVDVTLEKGRVRRAYAAYTIPTADEVAVGTVINMFKLPKGARIVDAKFSAPDDETSGIVVVGWDGGADSLETANDDAIFDAVELDFGNALINARMLQSNPGYNHKLLDTVNIQLTGTEASNASGDNVLELEVFYVLD
jgi:hypothetical protein